MRESILRSREVPVRYLEEVAEDDALEEVFKRGGAKFSPNGSWTSPYWHAPWFEPCVLADASGAIFEMAFSRGERT